MARILSTKVTVTKTIRGYITAADIIEAFDLPETTSILFSIPGGGDYSNMALEVSEHPLYVLYEEITDYNEEEEK